MILIEVPLYVQEQFCNWKFFLWTITEIEGKEQTVGNNDSWT
jgi:hypothetical protein